MFGSQKVGSREWGEDLLQAGWGEGGGQRGTKTAGPLHVPIWVFYKWWPESAKLFVQTVRAMSDRREYNVTSPCPLQAFSEGACSGHKNHKIKILPFINYDYKKSSFWFVSDKCYVCIVLTCVERKDLRFTAVLLHAFSNA